MRTVTLAFCLSLCICLANSNYISANFNQYHLDQFEMDVKCFPCLPGKYSNKNSHCGECPPGSCEDINNCTLCDPGTFNNHTNATSCDTCPDNKIAKDKGSSTCSFCQGGFQANKNHTDCEACQAGWKAESGEKCTECPIGHFSSVASDTCKPCPPGTYGDMKGAGYCNDCGQGRYNPNIGQTSKSACQVCPANNMCPTNETSNPTPCGFLFTSDQGSSECNFSIWFYVIVGGTAGLAVIFLIVGLVTYRWYVRRITPAPERKRLIPEPLPGPVYDGY